jgi:hypothetical protein
MCVILRAETLTVIKAAEHVMSLYINILTSHMLLCMIYNKSWDIPVTVLLLLHKHIRVSHVKLTTFFYPILDHIKVLYKNINIYFIIHCSYQTEISILWLCKNVIVIIKV